MRYEQLEGNRLPLHLRWSPRYSRLCLHNTNSMDHYHYVQYAVVIHFCLSIGSRFICGRFGDRACCTHAYRYCIDAWPQCRRANCPPETAQAFDSIVASERANGFHIMDITIFARWCVLQVVYSVSYIDKVKVPQRMARL